MKKRICLILLTLIFCFSCAACTSPSENKVKLENLVFVPKELSQSKEKVIPEQTVSFRIWTTSLATASDITGKLDQIEGKDYQSISLYLLWSDFEYEQGKYSFSFIDELVPLIISRGYKIDLTLVLWTYNLSWKDALDFQQTRTGENFSYDEIRNETLSIFSEKNKNCIKNSIFALADHCNKTFGENIAQWSVVLSPSGKTELSSFAGTDCSEPAKTAFYAYLQDKYSEISVLNSHLSRQYESWEALKQTEFSTLTDLAAFDYEIFTKEALSSLIKETTTAFQSVSQAIPVVLKITDPTSVFAAKTMGLSEIYSLTQNTGIDLLSFVAAENPTETAFICDLIRSVTGLPVSVEIDSATLSKEAEEENMQILSGRAILAETANFDGDSPSASTFGGKDRQNLRPKEIILVNSLDFLKQPPTEGLYRKLRAAYTGMSQNGEGLVTIFSDLQIIDHPELLSGTEEIHLGALSETVYLYPALAEILASYSGRITDNQNEQPRYKDQYETEIAEEYTEKINEKLKEG